MNNDMREKADLQRRKANLTKGIRSMKPEDTTRKPCFICGKWQSITHCHHIVEVHKLVEWCLEHDFLFLFLPVTFVWLCPNHHEWIHRLGDNNNSDARCGELVSDITDAEWEEYLKLEQLERDMYREMYARYWLIEGVKDHHEQRRLILERMDNQKQRKEERANDESNNI